MSPQADPSPELARAGPLRVLFLCTRNSARSQIAEAIMTQRLAREHPPRFVVASAGAQPADAVHPLALRVLASMAIDWSGHEPKGLETVRDRSWDLIITVCDRAKESCPTFPGQPVFAHWGMDDPGEVTGDEATRERAFRATVTYVSRRVDLLFALRYERLQRHALAQRAQHIDIEAKEPELTATPWQPEA